MIFADDREPERITEILSSLGLRVVRKRLTIADYLVYHQGYAVAIERKSASDYISSIADGRFFNQIHDLSRSYQLSFLCIVGRPDFSRIKRDAFIGSLLSIPLKTEQRVIPIQVESDEEFCLILKSLNRQLERGNLKTAPRLRRVDAEDSIAMLTAIPGIGVEKARRLLEKLGSIQRVVNASIPELMRVEGIGEKQARRIYDFVRGRKIR
ncbi:DNA repair protein [Archaeoglobales archaeon]|nr:MAG: DNA repair protein [Archaeoglobales archaeon]